MKHQTGHPVNIRPLPNQEGAFFRKIQQGKMRGIFMLPERESLQDEPAVVGYTLDLMLERNEEAVNALLNKKGRFILATNDMDAEGFPAARMLAEYKAQQEAERGF